MFSSNNVILGLLNFMGLLIVVSQQNVVTLVNKEKYVEHVNIMNCKPGKKEIRLRTGKEFCRTPCFAFTLCLLALSL